MPITNSRSSLTFTNARGARMEATSFIVTKNISFTGNAINYLAAIRMPIDLNEWEWHEEFIDGKKYYIITDRKQSLS